MFEQIFIGLAIAAFGGLCWLGLNHRTIFSKLLMIQSVLGLICLIIINSYNKGIYNFYHYCSKNSIEKISIKQYEMLKISNSYEWIIIGYVVILLFLDWIFKQVESEKNK